MPQTEHTEHTLESFLGKTVIIYPNDTHQKMGVVESLSPAGVVFRITQAHSQSGYKVGEVAFIAFSARLSFKLPEQG